jgi:hypothetical protein
MYLLSYVKAAYAKIIINIDNDDNNNKHDR